MTPKIINYDFIDNDKRVIELSSGYDFGQKIVWGVTELKYNEKARFSWESTKKGELFTDYAKAQKYYKKLLTQ